MVGNHPRTSRFNSGEALSLKRPWVALVEFYDAARFPARDAALYHAMEKARLQAPTPLRWKVFFDPDGDGSRRAETLIEGTGTEITPSQQITLNL
jgi:hypothetical protein